MLTASERLGTPNLAGGGRLLLLLLHNSHPWLRSSPPGSVSESPGASLPAGTAAARPCRDISQKLQLPQSPAAALLQPQEQLLLLPDLLIRLAGGFTFPLMQNIKSVLGFAGCSLGGWWLQMCPWLWRDGAGVTQGCQGFRRQPPACLGTVHSQISISGIPRCDKRSPHLSWCCSCRWGGQ